MRAVIDGKRYDTETSTEVASIENGYTTDYRYCREGLYITARGNWFLAGWGNAMSPYATVSGSTRSPGERVTVVTPTEAQEWLEEHSKVNTLEKYFGELIEDA